MVVFFGWIAGCLVPPDALALDIMLPQMYSEGMEIKGWLMSEKLDGVRGYWDGSRLLSKNGIALHPSPVGAVITFKYYGLFQSGRPRFPSFLRVRMDT